MMRGLMLLALLCAAPVLAQEETSSEDRALAAEKFYAGKELFDSGRYEAAAGLWEEAYELSREPDLLWNLVNAYERAGNLELALERLQAYREFASEDEFDKVRERVIVLSERVASLRAEETQREKERAEREAELERERQRVAQLEEERKGRADKLQKLVLPAASYGVGAASLLTGAVFHGRASSAKTDLDTLCAMTDSGRLCPTTANDAKRRRSTSAAIAWGTYGLGVAAIATGTVLLLKSRTGDTPDAPTAWIAPTPSGLAAGVHYAF